jgi:hypothetical protein
MVGFQVTIQGSGFEAKKQAIFCQSSLLFEGDAAHRLKKEARDGGKLTFLDQNVSTLNSYVFRIKYGQVLTLAA